MKIALAFLGIVLALGGCGGAGGRGDTLPTLDLVIDNASTVSGSMVLEQSTVSNPGQVTTSIYSVSTGTQANVHIAFGVHDAYQVTIKHFSGDNGQGDLIQTVTKQADLATAN